MRYNFFTCCIIAVTWTVGDAMDDRDLHADGSSSMQQYFATLADLGTNNGGDSTCANVCNESEIMHLSSVTMDIEKEEEGDGIAGFVGKIIDGIANFFNNGSVFGHLMNGLLNLFRPRQNITPRFEIPTDMIAPVLLNYSMKVKSLVELIRSESDTFVTASDTPDIMKSIFDLSAENMESLASLIDPIVEEMRLHKTMNLTTVSCSIGQLLAHLRDDTLVNIESIAEVIYTKSGNEEMEDRYIEYRIAAAKTTPSDLVQEASSTPVQENSSNQCYEHDTGKAVVTTMVSETPIQARIGGGILGNVGRSILQIVSLIILFPVSIIVSIVTTVLALFLLVIIGDSSGIDRSTFFFVLGIIFSPLLIVVAILIIIGSFLLCPTCPGPFTTSDVDEQAKDVMDRLSMVLKSPMESMVKTLKLLYGNEINEEDEDTRELDCQIKTMACHNNQLFYSLPF